MSVSRLYPEVQRIQETDDFLDALKTDIRHNGHTFYRPATDQTQMPQFEMFREFTGHFNELTNEMTFSA